MEGPTGNAQSDAPSDVLYTCWPLGGVLCGLATMAIGALILADHYLDTPPEVLWGIGLIVLGGAVVLWSRVRNGGI